MRNIINHQTKHESWEEGRVELKPLTAEDEDIKVAGKQITQLHVWNILKHLQVFFSYFFIPRWYLAPKGEIVKQVRAWHTNNKQQTSNSKSQWQQIKVTLPSTTLCSCPLRGGPTRTSAQCFHRFSKQNSVTKKNQGDYCHQLIISSFDQLLLLGRGPS